ncbi:MAG TPA: crossover junction endodeoxyribonuclease RuvC [Planctomycetes bacterium]|nr:crossover junction endodeoxyribonuclease RuvC [Planctomycetota bacterium]
MRVLGIDPGTRKVGFGFLDQLEPRHPNQRAGRCGNLVRPLFSGGRNLASPVPGGAGILSLGSSQVPIQTRLQILARGLRELIREWRPDVIAVEEAFFGKSVQAALRIGESRGVVLLIAAESGLPVVQYSPAVIKKRVSGNGRASKAQLAQALSASLPIQVEDLAEDATDALAIAFCHLLSLLGNLEKTRGGA